MSIKVIIDTNVLVAGLIGGKGPNREILRLCFKDTLQPYIGNALYKEYQDLLSRENIQELCKQTSLTLSEFLDDFANICKPIEVWFLWRPNIKDEADNHIIELAVAANIKFIVTNNISDFAQAELQQVGHTVITPPDLLKLLRKNK
jgi:putative PIN family toxin of toxin-antitoxin system